MRQASLPLSLKCIACCMVPWVDGMQSRWMTRADANHSSCVVSSFRWCVVSRFTCCVAIDDLSVETRDRQLFWVPDLSKQGQAICSWRQQGTSHISVTFANQISNRCRYSGLTVPKMLPFSDNARTLVRSPGHKRSAACIKRESLRKLLRSGLARR